jgi:DNA-binding helix-hairpin-helix protein with protein kinase domain
MLEYTDVDERREALKALHGIEQHVWVRAGGAERVRAVADEDLERATEEKTSAVHFLRFELDEAARRAMKSGEPIAVGIDHPHYRFEVDPLPERLRAALAADID